MTKQERPEIELYLYSMNQEFPVEKGHAAFLGQNSEVRQDLNGKLICKEELGSQTFQ